MDPALGVCACGEIIRQQLRGHSKKGEAGWVAGGRVTQAVQHREWRNCDSTRRPAADKSVCADDGEGARTKTAAVHGT